MSEDKPVSAKQFNEFVENLVEQLNKVHTSTCRRLDDIEQRMGKIETRLGNIEGNITHVRKHTEIIPEIFEILHIDGEDIAKLTTRITKLEN